MVHFDQILRMHVKIVYPLACVTAFLIYEALLSISPAGRSQLVKMLITLVPHDIFRSNFAYLNILILSSYRYEKR